MIDKRTLLYIALAMVGFLLFNAWQAEHIKQTTQKPAASQPATSAGAKADSDLPPEIASGEKPAALAHEPVSAHAAGRGELVTVTTDVLKLTIDSKGGNIIGADLLKYAKTLKNPDVPVSILSDDPSQYYVAQSGLIGKQGPDRPDKGQVTYKVSQRDYQLADGKDSVAVDLTWTNGKGVQVTKRITLKRGKYDMTVDYLVSNQGKTAWEGNFYAQIQRKKIKGKNGSMFGFSTYRGAAISSPDTPYEKIKYKAMDKENLNRTIEGGWVAMQQQYFLSVWIPQQDQTNHYFSRVRDTDIYKVGFMGPKITVGPGAQTTEHAQFYVGPEIQDNLKPLAPGLEKTIDFGWLFFISTPIYWLLSFIHKYVGNWGWSIVIVTILIKSAFYKLSETSYRSMAKLKDLQPRMNAMKERFGDDKQKMSKAMMELYKKEKVNPLGGCLPMIIQMPFFIALYYVLIESVQLRHAPFIFWIQDLSTKDPFYVLPGIMMVAMLLQTRLNPTPPDKTQAMMMYIMPVMFTALFSTFPAGLVLYWVVNTLFSIGQQWYITQKFEKSHPKKALTKS